MSSKREEVLLRVPLVPLPNSPASTRPPLRHFETDEGPYRQNSHNFTSFGFTSDRGDEESTSYGSEPDDSWLTANPIRRLFQRGNDIESVRANHHYTREERVRLSDFESIDYLPPNSAVYRQWLTKQPFRRQWDRWFMMGSIGVTVGVMGFCLYSLIDTFAFFKYHTIRWLLAHTNLGVAWLFNMVYSLTLVFIATYTVVQVAPTASGAGVAEVMAYLNGCSISKLFNARTLFVKFLSCAAAVGSGLPVGPEGPMVHIGAMIGAGLSQGHSTTLGFSTGLFQRFRNPKDKRDFVTAGVAVGVATAFGAPIGGLLFAFEEVASFFSQSLGWLIFFACTVAVLSLDTLRSAQRSLREGHFGLFAGDASIVFEVQTQLTNHLMAIGPAIVIGILCGILAIIFTVVNVKVARLRADILKGRKWWMMAEPLVIIAVFTTLGMLLPLAFPCTPTECVIRQGMNMPFCPPGESEHVKRIVEETLELYTCSATAQASDMPTEWLQPNASEAATPRNYNELATLMSVTGEDAIRHLLTRGTHREFGYGALLVMLVFYFAGAAWCAGSAISSGLFVPMLLMGSCVGRIVGLGVVDLAASHGYGSEGAPPGVFLSPSPWAWIDPGAFALIGAGAFMGGVTRLTLSLAVIMMEVSNDVRMLLPLLAGILVAKWVADAVTHSLYHSLLEVKCVPFLPHEVVSKRSLDLVAVHHVMSYPVVTVREAMPLRDIRTILRDTSHNGFPVVRDTSSGQVFVGLVVRDHLMVLLLRAIARGSTAQLEIPYEELNRRFVSAAAQRFVSEQQLAVLQGRMGGVLEDTSPLFDEVLDLTPYINTSAPSVNESFSVERTYTVFRGLGLRHLVVLDEHNHVKGIVTRKDLLGYKLDEAAERARVPGRSTSSASLGMLTSLSMHPLEGYASTPTTTNGHWD